MSDFQLPMWNEWNEWVILRNSYKHTQKFSAIKLCYKKNQINHTNVIIGCIWKSDQNNLSKILWPRAGLQCALWDQITRITNWNVAVCVEQKLANCVISPRSQVNEIGKWTQKAKGMQFLTNSTQVICLCMSHIF